MTGHAPGPARHYLESHYLPLCVERAPVLSVGVQRATASYRRLSGIGAAFVSVDRLTEQEGTRPDIVADVTDPALRDLCCDIAPFGMVLVHGVLGYGIDTDVQIDAALGNLVGMLREGGRLVMSWTVRRVPWSSVSPIVERHGLTQVPVRGSIPYSWGDWRQMITMEAEKR